VVRVGTDEDVLEGGHVVEQPDVLERARDAELGDLELLALAQAVPEEPDAARRRLIDAGHDVEAGCLAGTVGSDQAQDLARVDVERDPVEGRDTTKAQRDIVHLEHLAFR
jgi:hypothetical protein